jgi:Replication-relaxation
VSGGVARRAYMSKPGLIQLREQLSRRDHAIIRQVAELRLMSARQIQAIHFRALEHQNELAATRARQRVLARLIRERLLTRLERRVGGVRAGSAGFIFALGPIGQRLLTLEGARRRAYEPTLRFVDHTLAIAQLVVDMMVASRQGHFDLLACQAEPRCWREFAGLGGRRVLRPDVLVALGVGEYELRWFVEVDRSTESLPTVRRKCQLYAEYYQSGQEQAAQGGVFPRVCWVVPDERRAERVRRAIGRDGTLPAGLFVVTSAPRAVDVLRGATP